MKLFKKFMKKREVFIAREMTKIHETFYRFNLDKFSGFKENLKVTGTEHKYPFGKIQMFEKMFFIFSHAAWSRKIVKRVNKVYDLNTLFITRSEWVAYFLSKCKLNLVYEL